MDIKKLTDIPDVGPAIAADLARIGISQPQELAGKDPYQLYKLLCEVTACRHDPCVIDVFISAVRYMEGGPPTRWWKFTAERKQKLAGSE